MKLAVIGGGGVRSMFLAKSIAQRASELNINELIFMDNNEEKLNIYGNMAKQTAKRINPDLHFEITTDAEYAVSDADYVITTIREGGDLMRVKEERIALNNGVLGQETTGASGFSFAMRSVSSLVEYCELIKKHAKKSCKVFNFTNPAGLVSQTLRDLGYSFTYGICDAPSGMIRTFAKLYNVDINDIEGEIYGLNHLSYFTSVKINGKEMLYDIINNDKAYVDTDLRYFEKELLLSRNAIFNEYLYYFYYREKAINNILKADKTRAELICEVNKSMTEELKKVDIENDFDKALEIFNYWYGIRESNYMAEETGIKRKNKWKFDIYEKDDGGYAGVALKFIEIEQSGKSGTMILCTENDGAIPSLKCSDIVEITCDIVNGKAVPHKLENTDKQCLELIRRVKNYERLASKAIINKSVSLAVDALTLHPLVNSYSLSKTLICEFLELNKEYTKDWK
ncbi:MAG: 6-phospho-beta-glucosidase [Eubacterium sp.]|nr:6-phospho-beta-glucosidase [Eubacterium sp.]